jgi:hypothetical protein
MAFAAGGVVARAATVAVATAAQSKAPLLRLPDG